MRRAIVLADDGFEDSEVLVPYQRLREEGVTTAIAGPEGGRTYRGRFGYPVNAAVDVDQIDPGDMDILIIPGGKAPQKMRRRADFVELAQACMDSPAIVGAIGRGPELLAEAERVHGRRMTAWPRVVQELQQNGALVVDKPVVVDRDLITSRMPDDLPAFNRALAQILTGRPVVTA